MTSAAEVSAPIVWITGLSGAGKTTLANAAAALLRADGRSPVVLDGDEVRRTLDPEHLAVRHDREQRLRRAFRLAAMAKDAALHGTPVIVATISLFHAVQRANRSGSTRYAEVLLSAGLDVLRARNPQRYGAAGCAGEADVVGVDIHPEFPVRPELALAQHFAWTDLAVHALQVVALVHRLEYLESIP